MIDTPKYYKLNGTGKLYAGDYKFNVDFEIFLINQRTVIYCRLDRSPVYAIDINYSTKWSIKGHDNKGKSVFATDLMITELNDDFAELISDNNIIIGDYFSFAANKVIYPLANLFDINFKCNFDGFHIVVRSKKDISKNISKYWKIPQTSAELILVKAHEPIDSFTKIANYIIKLLSLGTGRHIEIGIQSFFSDSKEFTLLQNHFTSSNYINPILLPYDLTTLFESGIPILKNWDTEKWKDFKIILDYINSTDDGYLDDRVLYLVQSFEIIAHNWFDMKYDLPVELKALKKNLKGAFKVWKKDYPEYDKEGFWSGRVHKSLEWNKTVELLENVLKSQSLSVEKLKVDFSKLVELRHAVAHKGRFGSTEVINDLQNGQFALRLFLLKTLGFNGKVNDYRGTGWSNYVDMISFEDSASA